MIISRPGRFTAIGVGLALLAAATSVRGEDALSRVAIDCGSSCAQLIAGEAFVSAPPGATFIVTLMHLPPVAEEALVDDVPVECAPIKARVDILSARIGAETLTVELGERNELAAGRSVQLVHTVEGRPGAQSVELSRIGFNLRADEPSPSCTLVASGFMFEDISSVPVPCRISLMSNLLPQLVFASGFEVLP